MDTPVEQDLIEQIRTGDAQAFEQLFHQYAHYLHNVAYNRLRSVDAADDIIQDVFTDLWRNRSALQIHSSLQAYLHQAVKFKVIKEIRRKSVREKELYIQRIRREFYEESSDAAEGEKRLNELKSLVNDQLNSLPEKSREIFILSRKENYTHREIAVKMNCSQKNVEYHIGKAMTHLRLNLKDYSSLLLILMLIDI